ncbi:MAG: DNA alkylation repair protein, partial [Pseudomonadota bacterium]
LFRKTAFAHRKAAEWTSREAEFVKRAGFTLVAVLAVHDRAADNSVFDAYLDLVEEASGDERRYVKKAVNWSLRQIGKRDKALFGKAMRTIHRISGTDSRSGRWIASDAGRELRRIGNERGWD